MQQEGKNLAASVVQAIKAFVPKLFYLLAFEKQYHPSSRRLSYHRQLNQINSSFVIYS